MTKALNFEYLFDQSHRICVPAYQRAYAWEEKQLLEFVRDLQDGFDKGGYYYGHFILERTKDNSLEIIDGQQRITTFILFLLVCSKAGAIKADNFVDKFKTVEYDQEAFELIRNNLDKVDVKWDLNYFGLNPDTQTLSISRIIFALNLFKEIIFNKASKIKLKREDIAEYCKLILEAHISIHIVSEKSVAVQIFELQNSRGMKLTLIEKVKSKLMKSIYLFGNKSDNEEYIITIQKDFAEIFRLEEQLTSRSFRGELSLEEILFHHLRIINDGGKQIIIDQKNFNSPAKGSNREEIILKYLDEEFNKIPNKKDIVGYSLKLASKFKSTVYLVSKVLLDLDNKNNLVGDVLILDKELSLEFFILLFHINKTNLIEDKSFVRKWEKLIFTRDFHEKYYRVQYRDNFSLLFEELCKNDNLVTIIDKYVRDGFRQDLMETGGLQVTVINYISGNKDMILNNAFHWWNEKMVYLLYKYEVKEKANLEKLRNIMKLGRSVEHILPQSWEWHWIDDTKKDPKNINEDDKSFNREIENMINGIGNLLLITSSENSSLSNSHPKEKLYTICSGGSYTKHNDNRVIWSDCKNWKKNIRDRGELLYSYLLEFLDANVNQG